MEIIRKAEAKDLCRIAEILVFSKRLNYRSIFHNDEYSFGELQVVNVMKEYEGDLEKLSHTWVYDDEFVKGLIEIEGKEIKTIYVEPLLTSSGIGASLLEFAIETYDVDHLWALEKNTRAIEFYNRHGFICTNEKIPEEGTSEYLVKLIRK